MATSYTMITSKRRRHETVERIATMSETNATPHVHHAIGDAHFESRADVSHVSGRCRHDKPGSCAA